MASITLLLVAVMSLYCGWNILLTTHRSLSAEKWLHSDEKPLESHNAFLGSFLDDMQTLFNNETSDSDSLLEIHADRARAPAELGWFCVDLAVRLGLLGTIIGFILIFASLDNINIQGGDDLKTLLIAMSGGMGTALYTTLTGLIGGSILSFQYLILTRQTEHFIAQLLRIRGQIRSAYMSTSDQIAQ